MPSKTKKAKAVGSITGIEFGRDAIRIATLSGNRQGQPLVRCLTEVRVDCGPSALIEDIRVAQVVALDSALGQHQKDLGTVVVGLPRDEVILRLVSLPSTDTNEIGEMLFFDLDRHIPFPPDDAEVAYRVVDQIGTTESRVLMSAARRSDLYSILDSLKEAGIQPDRLDVDIAGLAYAVTYNRSNDSPAAFLQLDHTTGYTGLLVGNQLRYSRTAGEGLAPLGNESGSIKLNGAPEDWSKDQQGWWDGMLRDLKLSLVSFAHEKYGETPQELFLTGAGSSVPGLPEQLSRAMEMPVSTVPPLKTAKGVSFSQPFTTAIGLAIGEIVEHRKINLIPEEIYQIRETAHHKQFLVNMAMLVVLNLILFGTWTGHSIWHKQQVINTYEEKIRLIKPEINDIDEIARKLEVIDKNIDTENSAFKVFKDVFQRTRERVKFDRIVFSKTDKVVFDFSTFENRDLNEFVDDLSKSPYVGGTIERGRASANRLNPTRFAVDRFLMVRGLTAMLRSNERLNQ